MDEDEPVSEEGLVVEKRAEVCVEVSPTLFASRRIAWMADWAQLLGRYGNQFFGNGFELVGGDLLSLVGEADQ